LDLEEMVSHLFVELVCHRAIHIRTEIDRIATMVSGPNLGPVNEDASDTPATVRLVDYQPPHFYVAVDHQQLPDIELDPADDAAVRSHGDMHLVALLLIESVQAQPHLRLGEWVA
jgi:hypothetical protein